ncbi:hypothetical protein L218DRAFT_884716, partial [Marasmius fiardii PR-910]
SDAASRCCGFRTGKCASAICCPRTDGGCGFGDLHPMTMVSRCPSLRGQIPASPAGGATPPPAVPLTNNGAGGAAVGNGKPAGTQFITGPCANDGECASGCCGFKSGQCASASIAQERRMWIWIGNPTPNDDAARKLRGRA